MKRPLQLRRLAAGYFIAGLLMFVVMTLVLNQIAEVVRNDEPFTTADANFSNWLHKRGWPPVTRFMFVVTAFGSTAVVTSVTVCIRTLPVMETAALLAYCVILTVFGGMALNKGLKFIFHRPRPYFDDPILTLTSYSFPSGHTMMATVLYCLLAVFLILKNPNGIWRASVILIAACLILLVGFSRSILAPTTLLTW